MGAGLAVVLLVRARGQPEAEGDPVAGVRRGSEDEARAKAGHAHGGLLPSGISRRRRHPGTRPLSLDLAGAEAPDAEREHEREPHDDPGEECRRWWVDRAE